MTCRKLRILSFNIHKGFTPGNRRFVLCNIREAIQSHGADLVFLQEVLGEHGVHSRTVPDWPESSQFEYLAGTLWPHFAYGRNAVYSEGHHGNALLSRYPIVKWENIDVSLNRFERRGLLHCVVEPPWNGPALHTICVHLNIFERGRALQLDALCRRIEQHVPESAPLILAGDFNDWRQRTAQRLHDRIGLSEAFLDLHGMHARTFPARRPVLQLDRVYFRGFRAEQAETFVEPPWNALSDHAALHVELSVPPALRQARRSSGASDA